MSNKGDTKYRQGLVTKENQKPGREYTLNNKGDTKSRQGVVTKETQKPGKEYTLNKKGDTKSRPVTPTLPAWYHYTNDKN